MRGLQWLAAVAALCAWTGGAMAQEVVHFPSFDGGTGSPGTTLDGYLFRAPGGGAHPAIVFLHGCGGLFSRGTGAINTREAEWAGLLNRSGYSVLMVDSWRPRGVDSTCAPANQSAAVVEARRHDPYAALLYLQSQPFVRADRIAVMGWSAGGGIVLDTVERRNPARPAVLPRGDFRAAVAFYPARCNTRERSAAWSNAIPLLILQGAADVWTPAAPCQEFAAAATAHGAQITLQLYPGAYHDFDWPNRPIKEYPQYTTRSGVVPVMGTDPAARTDAQARVPAYLARYLGN